MNSAPRIRASSNIPFSTITLTMTKNRVQLASASAARWKMALCVTVVVRRSKQQLFNLQRNRARLDQLLEWNRRRAAGRDGVAEAAQFLEVSLVRLVAVPEHRSVAAFDQLLEV